MFGTAIRAVSPTPTHRQRYTCRRSCHGEGRLERSTLKYRPRPTTPRKSSRACDLDLYTRTRSFPHPVPWPRYERNSLCIHFVYNVLLNNAGFQVQGIVFQNTLPWYMVGGNTFVVFIITFWVIMIFNWCWVWTKSQLQTWIYSLIATKKALNATTLPVLIYFACIRSFLMLIILIGAAWLIIQVKQ